jgi:hypothetical protein
MTDGEYVPGTCNIGPQEIARRRTFGWTGAVISIILLAVLMYTGVNRWWRLFVFFPAGLCAVGFLQAHFRFCYAYGRLGIFNFGVPGKGHRVQDDAAKLLDKKKANQILLYVVLIAVAVALIAAAI